MVDAWDYLKDPVNRLRGREAAFIAHALTKVIPESLDLLSGTPPAGYASQAELDTLQAIYDAHVAAADPYAGYIKADGTREMTDWLRGAKVGGGTEPLIRSRGMGFNQTTFPGVQIGQAAGRIALGIDPASITGSNFHGSRLEILLPNAAYFLQANSGGTNWVAQAFPPLCLVNGKAGFGTDVPAEVVDVVGNIKATGFFYSGTGHFFTENGLGFIDADSGAFAGFYPYLLGVGGVWAHIGDGYIRGSTDAIGSRVRDMIQCHIDIAGAGSDYVLFSPDIQVNGSLHIVGAIKVDTLTASRVVFTDVSQNFISKAPPTVTGATVDAALISLLAGLATMGLVIDNHT